MVRVTLRAPHEADKPVDAVTCGHVRQAAAELYGRGLLQLDGTIMMDDARTVSAGDTFTWIAAHGAEPSPTRTFHLKWGSRRHVVKCAATLASLEAAVELTWAVLKIRDYEFQHETKLVVEADLPMLATSAQEPLQVKLTGQSFSMYKQTGQPLKELAFKMLGVEMDGSAGPTEDDSVFTSLEFDMDNKHIKGKPAKHTVSVMTEAMLLSLSVMTSSDTHPELSQRAFITPVLALAVLVARESLEREPGQDQPVLAPEHLVAGSRAWGPVDFVILYRLIGIVVVEAKRLDLKDAWAQLIMQICSVRELMLSSLGGDIKKRKAFQARELEELDTYAIICTATTYQLLRFRPGNNHRKPTLMASSSIILPLFKTSGQDVFVDQVTKLVLRIAKIVCDAVVLIDEAKSAHPELSTASNTEGLPDTDFVDVPED